MRSRVDFVKNIYKFELCYVYNDSSGIGENYRIKLHVINNFNSHVEGGNLIAIESNGIDKYWGVCINNLNLDSPLKVIGVDFV